MTAHVTQDPLAKAYVDLSETVKDINKKISFYNFKTVVKTFFVFLTILVTHLCIISACVNSFSPLGILLGILKAVPVSYMLNKLIEPYKEIRKCERNFAKSMQKRITDLFSTFKENIRKAFNPVKLNSIHTINIFEIADSKKLDEQFGFSYRYFGPLDKLKMEEWEDVKNRYNVNKGLFSFLS